MNQNSNDETEETFTECPECGGRLQHQTRADTMCLECETVFYHELRSGGRHLLWLDGAIVDRHQDGDNSTLLTDGGSDTSVGETEHTGHCVLCTVSPQAPHDEHTRVPMEVELDGDGLEGDVRVCEQHYDVIRRCLIVQSDDHEYPEDDPKTVLPDGGTVQDGIVHIVSFDETANRSTDLLPSDAEGVGSVDDLELHEYRVYGQSAECSCGEFFNSHAEGLEHLREAETETENDSR